MSIQDWKLENDLCRCCHSEGTYLNLAEPCMELQGEEIYSEMLEQCLDINITPIPGPLCAATYAICPNCIMRLRDAFLFKEQVKKCEIKFKELYDKEAIKLSSFVEVKLKDEVPDAEMEVVTVKQDDTFDADYYDDATNICEIELKPEKELESTRPKRAKAKPKAKAVKTRKVKPVEDKGKQGVKAPAAPKFRLLEADYTKDGGTYQCRKCDKKYDKIFSLKFHLKTKHYKIPRFPCPYCAEVFMTPAPLTVHKLNEHGLDERFKCNACKGTFNTKVQLRKHINNFHMMGEKYKCEFCDYESFSFEGMYKHKFKHKTVKDYHCRFCRKAFLRKTTLDLHERIHTGDRRKVCSVCSKAFVQKASLNYHMTKYHPEVNY